MQNVFIIGSKGIPAAYGGYETFVDKLTEYHRNNDEIKYHVACKGKENKEYIYHNARCFMIKVPDIGSAQAIYYDVAALKECCRYIEKKQVKQPVIYILACRIGPFIRHYVKKIHKLGGKVYVNPDGHEWMRQKWNAYVQKYWKISEQMMVKNADLLIGVGGEIIVTRPTIFGPEPEDIATRVFHSSNIRKMAHSAEDLVELFLPDDIALNCEHGDVLNGFLILFHFKPEIDIKYIENKVKEMIKKDIPIQYYDEKHVKIGGHIHPCSGPRIHVNSTSKIENFKLLPKFYYDSSKKVYMLVGLVGDSIDESYKDLNKI